MSMNRRAFLGRVLAAVPVLGLVARAARPAPPGPITGTRGRPEHWRYAAEPWARELSYMPTEEMRISSFGDDEYPAIQVDHARLRRLRREARAERRKRLGGYRCVWGDGSLARSEKSIAIYTGDDEVLVFLDRKLRRVEIWRRERSLA